jgi:tRNA (Thr-GGU) A37 N-methylase
LVVVLLVINPFRSLNALAQPAPSKPMEATVSSVIDDKLVIVPIGKPTAITVEVPKGLQETVKGLEKGNVAIVQLTQEDGKTTLKSLSRKMTREGTVAAKAGESAPLSIVPDGETDKLTLEVSESHRAFVKDLQKGDKVIVQYVEDKDKNSLTRIDPKTEEIGWIVRLFVLSGTSILFVIVLALFTSGELLNPIIGYDNRYSNSQFQLVVWFGVLFVAYVSTLFLRGWYSCASGFGMEFLDKVNIPEHLFEISGLSAFGFAAARGITAYKAPPSSNAKPAGTPAFPGDLVRNDEGKVDLGDLQMLIITLLAAGVYLLQDFTFLAPFSS